MQKCLDQYIDEITDHIEEKCDGTNAYLFFESRQEWSAKVFLEWKGHRMEIGELNLYFVHCFFHDFHDQYHGNVKESVWKVARRTMESVDKYIASPSTFSEFLG